MENTSHNLYQESLSAKINRLEQTIREIQGVYKCRQEEVDTLQDYILEIKQNETKQKIEIRSLKEEIDRLTNLHNSVNTIKNAEIKKLNSVNEANVKALTNAQSQIKNQLMNINELGEALTVKAEVEEDLRSKNDKLTSTVNSLIDQVEYWKSLTQK